MENAETAMARRAEEKDPICRENVCSMPMKSRSFRNTAMETSRNRPLTECGSKNIPPRFMLKKTTM